MKEIHVFTDGGSRGNPGEAAIGGVVYLFEKGNRRLLGEISERIGWGTNNEAEYKAVIKALEWIKENVADKPKRIIFHLDSSLVYNQLSGFFKVKKGKIREYIFKIRGLENEINVPIIYKLVRREENREADKLVNQAFLKAKEKHT